MDLDAHILSILPALSEISPCPREIDEIILYYLRWLLIEQYKWRDLKNIPHGIHTCMLCMIISTPKNMISCEGEVDVIRYGSRYIFKFMMNGANHILTNGLLKANCMTFNTIPAVTITFVSHRFEN